MRTNKAGEPPIPALTLGLLANAHRRVADEVRGVLSANKSAEDGPLWKALLDLFKREVSLAEVLDELRRETKPGRPKMRRPNALMALTGTPASRPKRGKAGRPTSAGPPFDLAAYSIVERRRAELATTRRTKPTIKAAIDLMNQELAREMGKRESTFVKAEYSSLRSAYQRGKRLSKKLQNPE